MGDLVFGAGFRRQDRPTPSAISPNPKPVTMTVSIDQSNVTCAISA